MRASFSIRLAAGLALALLGSAWAEDWPMYMHDPARSGVSGETLPLPLAALWAYTPPASPTPAWPDPQAERSKLTFDDATQVALAEDAVYFGSPVDNGIHALDARTGATRWTFFTEGPVRLAPTVADGRLYAGSDDGAVYCLEAKDGALVWSARPMSGRTRILGSGRVMSLWPVRTDVLVDGGVAYCGAGLFPARETTVVALDAKTGQTLWQMARPSKTNKFLPPIPQGYLVASTDQLYVPRGRAPAQFIARRDGAFRASPEGMEGVKGVISGDYGVLIGSRYVFGTQSALYGVEPDGKRMAIWLETRQMVATSNRLFRLAVSRGVGERTSVVALERVSGDVPGKLGESAKKDTLWTSPQSNLQAMVVAGPYVIAGGAGEVVARDAATGKEAWKAPVDGLVKGLAVANGRLVVSTDKGCLYGFGKGPAAGSAVKSPVNAFPADTTSARTAALAESLAKDAGVERGYGLVIGGDGARLALELAKRTGLRMHVAEADSAKAAAARAALSAAGVYGTKVVVDVSSVGTGQRLSRDGVAAGATNALPYPPYFANLVVVDAAALGQGAVTAKEVLRVLKPCGGVLYVEDPEQSRRAAWSDVGAMTEVKLAGTNVWTKLVRGALPGAGDWSHQFADAGNTGSSDDARVKGRLDVLWYGEPGPDKMQDRHTGTQAPLFVAGRMYAQGIRNKMPLLMCFDAYNGVPYWEREVPGAQRLSVMANCGNLAASTAGLFVATGAQCLHLDPATGATRRTFTLPAREGGETTTWAFVAVVGDTLIGSASPTHAFSDEVFAYDVPTGQLKWRHKAPVVRNATLAAGGGRVFFAEHRGETKAPRVLSYEEYLKQLLAERRGGKPESAKPKAKEKAKDDDEDGPGEGGEGAGEDDASPAATPAKESYRRTAVALDLATGQELWAREVDLTDCGTWGGRLAAATKRDILVFFGTYNAYGRGTGDEAQRRALALSAKDGSELWSKPLGNFVRPVLVGDRLVARPHAVQLATGEPLMVADGKRSVPWRLASQGACGQMSASASLLFYRIGQLIVMDAETGNINMSFQGMRPGCLINAIPAGGVTVMVEASSGCSCPHAALQSTVALVPVGAE